MENGNYSILPESQGQTRATILPSVWQMYRKQDIKTRNIKKWKVLLKIDGSRIKKSIHYKQTYALVDYWNSIQFVLILSLVHKWKILQLDYVLEFSQAPVQIDFTTTSSNLR